MESHEEWQTLTNLHVMRESHGPECTLVAARQMRPWLVSLVLMERLSDSCVASEIVAV